MPFDFDRTVNRRGTGSVKWDVGENELPMWVADMDFEVPPCVSEAILERASHKVYGYSVIPDEWYAAYSGWWERRHGLRIEKEWMVFCTGVVPAISSCVRRFTAPNENVVIQTPVYNCFFSSILNNGARILENPLTYSDGSYSIDFDDLEKKLKDPQTTLMILCNPQNPSGNIWTREELSTIADLALRYHVKVISDEIHCDITEPGKGYVPFASVSDAARYNSMTLIAPTKTFNIAGIKTAAVVVPDPDLKHKTWRALETDEVAEPNAFSCCAAVAAFENGGEWLDELRRYVYANRTFAEEYIKERIPSLKAVHGEATYLMWIDVSGADPDSVRFSNGLRKKTGLFICPGKIYGGEGFIRLNLACPRTTLEDGLKRLESFCG